MNVSLAKSDIYGCHPNSIVHHVTISTSTAHIVVPIKFGYKSIAYNAQIDTYCHERPVQHVVANK